MICNKDITECYQSQVSLDFFGKMRDNSDVKNPEGGCIMAKGRQTPQKKIILHLIQNSRLPLTAEQVFEQARRQFPSLALTTVYRNLEAFAAEGLVHASVYDDGVKRYELAEHHRHYMTCVECKKSVEIPECPFEELKDKLAQETGFDISGHSMEFFGTCPECRRRHERQKG